MNEKKIHPLKRWMGFNDISSPQLAKRSGVSASMIRYICSFKYASVRKYGMLSDATGIPPLVLIYPEENINFDITKCKPNINPLSRKCAAV